MTFNCADALAEVSKDFAALPVTTRAGKTVNLKSILMLPDEGLKSALAILGDLDDAKEEKEAGSILELLPKLRDLLFLVADDAKALKAEMADWPLGMFMNVIGAWQEATELGEAQPSDD